MRFLLEANKEAMSKDDYIRLSDKDRYKLIYDSLKDNQYITVKDFADYISEDRNTYFTEHPLYKIANKIPKKIDKLTEYTLLELGDNPKYQDIISNSDWIHSKSLYNGTDDEIAYKIKALTLCDYYGKDINELRPEGKWLSIRNFKNKTNELLSDSISKKSKNINNDSRAKQLSSKTGADEETISKVLNVVDNEIEKSVKNVVDQLTSIRGMKITKKDAEEFARTNLSDLPSMSSDELVLRYLRQR